MARRGGRGPNVLRPENITHRSRSHTVGGDGHRRADHPSRWVVPLLLGLLGVGVLLLGRGRDCLPLAGAPDANGPLEACSTSWAPGAVVFALICWLAGAFVWFSQRRD